jgi:Flp pilus assembly protein TadB
MSGWHTMSAMERKIFWISFVVLGLVADVLLPLWWALFATIPIAVLSWWVAYRSEWFG